MGSGFLPSKCLLPPSPSPGAAGSPAPTRGQPRGRALATPPLPTLHPSFPSEVCVSFQGLRARPPALLSSCKLIASFAPSQETTFLFLFLK